MHDNAEAAAVAARRRYVLNYGEAPWSVNTERNWHRMQRHTAVKRWRRAFAWLAREQRIPNLGRIVVVAQPFGVRQDTGNCYPAVKAAIDGLIDAGVIDNDDRKHVARIELVAPAAGDPGLRLIVFRE